MGTSGDTCGNAGQLLPEPQLFQKSLNIWIFKYKIYVFKILTTNENELNIFKDQTKM